MTAAETVSKGGLQPALAAPYRVEVTAGMKAREELLNRLPREGFLKISRSQAVDMAAEAKAALIRKGNELFNRKQYEEAKKIFLTTGYTDGLIRVGNFYLGQNNPLEALRMYWLAPDRKKVEVMLEKTVGILQKWLKEEG
jgi:hypothetical protein